MDEDQEVQVDHPFERPLPFAREIALPQRVGMTREKLVPRIWVGMRIGGQPCFLQDVAYSLTRYLMPEPVQGLAYFGVSPSRLGSDSND